MCTYYIFSSPIQLLTPHPHPPGQLAYVECGVCLQELDHPGMHGKAKEMKEVHGVVVRLHGEVLVSYHPAQT